MNDNGISPIAYFCLLVTFILEVDFVTIGRELATLAGPDAWLSAVMGAVLLCLPSYMIVKLASKFSDENIFEYAPRITGSFSGKVLTIWLALFWFFNAVRVTRGLSEGVKIFLLYTTPVPVTAGLMIALCVYAVLQGIHTLARSSQLLLAITIATIGLITLLSFGEFDISNFLPFLYKGAVPVIKGGLRTAGAFQGIELLLVLYPFITDKNRLKVYHYAGTVFVGFAACLAVVISVGVFGSKETGRLIWPFMALVKTFAIPGRLLERMEPVLMVGTVAIAYTTIVVNLWLTGIALSYLNRKIKREIIFLITGFAMFACSSSRIVAGTYAFLSEISLISSWITLYGLPVLLLLLYRLRGHRHVG